MDILLIRHGQSVANQMGLLISNDTDGLTKAGIEQSRKLASKLAFINDTPNNIYCSPWRRARATAEIVFSKQFDCLEFDGRLAETDPGQYGTWQESEFNKQFPDFYTDLNRKYEGGESHMDMAKRVCSWLDAEIIPKKGDQGLIAVVAHGGPITVILQYLLGMSIESQYPTFTVPNASYSKLVWREDLNRYCAICIGHQPE